MSIRAKLPELQKAMAERQPIAPEPKAIAELERQAHIKKLLPDIKKDYAEGMSVNAISAKYKIARGTINNYLGEEKGTGRSNAWRIIERRLPALAQNVTSAAIKKRNEEMALRILEKAGVFPVEPQQPTSINDVRLQLAIQNLLPTNAVNPNAVVTPAEQKAAARGDEVVAEVLVSES